MIDVSPIGTPAAYQRPYMNTPSHSVEQEVVKKRLTYLLLLDLTIVQTSELLLFLHPVQGVPTNQPSHRVRRLLQRSQAGRRLRVADAGDKPP